MLPSVIRRAIVRTSKINSTKLISATLWSDTVKTGRSHINSKGRDNLAFTVVRMKSALATFSEEDESLEMRPNHPLEKQSRFLLVLLDDFILGRSTGVDSVTTQRCNAVISALTEEGTPETLERCERILSKMEDIGRSIEKTYDVGQVVATPDYFSYWSIMDAYLQLGEQKYNDKAYEILHRMETAVQEGFCTASLPHIYDRFKRSFIFAKQSSGLEQRNHPELCEKALLEMMKPDTKTFNYVLHLWAKSGRVDSSKRAEELLQKVTKWSRTQPHFNECKPDIFSFNTVLGAYAERGDGMRADSLMKLMEELYDIGEHEFKPDMISYISTLSAWCKNRRDATLAAKKADEILQTMIQEFGGKEGKGVLKPQLFTMVIKAYAKCKNESSVSRAEQLISQMEQLGMNANKFVYNALLETVASSKMKDSNKKAEEVIERMKEESAQGNKSITPDQVSFTLYIKSLFLTNFEDPIKFLRKLEEDVENGNSAIEFDSILYSTLLSTCIKVNADAYVANEILDHMELRFKNGHFKSKPNQFFYRTVMKSWLFSPCPTKGQKSYELLRKMETNRGDEPLSLYDYNMVLATCAKVMKTSQNQKNSTMEVAIKVFKKIQCLPNLQASSQTYYSMLETCVNLIPNRVKSNKAIETFFFSCKEDGMVNSNIMELIRQHCTTKFQAHLFGGENKKFKDLPLGWTCNSANNDGQIRVGKSGRKIFKKMRV